MPRQYYVYIMASERQTLYTGVTNDLAQRVYQHKKKLVPGFTSKYDCAKLVYYETTEDIRAAMSERSRLRVGFGTRRWR
jgi:putative endonuclease